MLLGICVKKVEVLKPLKQKIGDLLQVRDEMVEKLMSFNGENVSCGCGHDHHQHD